MQTVQAFVLRQAWLVGMQPRGRWWVVDDRLLCFGKRKNPEPVCWGVTLLFLQVPWRPKAPGSLGVAEQNQGPPFVQ